MTLTPTPTRDPAADFRAFRARYGTRSPLQRSRPAAPMRIPQPGMAASLAAAVILIGHLVSAHAPDRTAAALPPVRPEVAVSTPAQQPAPSKSAAPKPEPATLPAQVVLPPVGYVEFPWLQVMDDGRPVTWPCGPIGYRVVLENAPAGVLELVAEATDRIAEVSGMQFRHDTPRQRLAERDTRYRGITIAWLPRAQFRTDDPRAIGYGGANWTGTKYTTGYVHVLDEWPGAHQAGFSSGGAGRLLLHELGHALGLNHIDDPNAVMYPVNQGVSTWSPAEQAALRYLKQACG